MKLLNTMSDLCLAFEKKFGSSAGYIYNLLGTLFFANTSFLVKRVSDIPYSQILFYRSALHSIFSYVLMAEQNIEFHSKSVKANRLMILRGMSGMITMCFWFYGTVLLPVSMSTVLGQTQPIFIGIMAIFILGERYEKAQIITGLLCLIGIIFIAQPAFLFGTVEESTTLSSIDRLNGVFAMVISSLAASVGQVLIRSVGGKSNVACITLYFGVVSTIVAPVVCMFQGVKEITVDHIPPIVAIGFFTFLAQLLKNRSALFGKAAKVALLNYVGVPYTYLIDIFVLGSEIDNFSLIGSVFVCSCLFVSIYQERLKK